MIPFLTWLGAPAQTTVFLVVVIMVAWLSAGAIVIDLIEWRFKPRDMHVSATTHLIITVGWLFIVISVAAMALYLRIRDGAWPERR